MSQALLIANILQYTAFYFDCLNIADMSNEVSIF